LSFTKRNILVCPLAWGAGHTTRMIPLMRELVSMGHNVLMGGDRWQNELVSREIPGITCIYFPGFSIRYSSYLPQYLKIILSLPAFLFQTLKEHFILGRVISKHRIDIIISDSRPGLWNRKIKSVLVTHMLRIPVPRPFSILESSLLPIIRAVIKQFTYCYVPDLPGDINLSGKLSHNLRIPDNVRFTGVLSRFGGCTGIKSGKEDYHFVAIMSGPSPQREILTGIVSSALQGAEGKSVILGGPEVEEDKKQGDNLTFIYTSHAEELAEKILSGRTIVTRPGYTTIMELYSLGRSALIIPTPGQPEQEYLAGYLSERGWFVKAEQKSFGYETLHKFKEPVLPPYSHEENRNLLLSALKELTD